MKKRYLFLIILVCLFAISAVSAEDNSTNNIISVSNDVNSLEANSNMNSVVNETDTLKVSNDDVLTAGNNWYVNSSKNISGDGKSEAGAFKTLNESLTVAQNGDTVMIASGTYTGNDNLNLTIAKRLNFIKYGDGEVIFDAESQSRIWSVTASLTNIIGLTFKNGKANGDGGAIYWVGADGNVSGCNFTGNTANNGGGAIFWYGDNGTVSGCNFTGNTANNNGGAIYWNSANGIVFGCNFTGNTVNYGGGAIYWVGADGTVSGCNFTGNTANYGGAIVWYGADGTVFGCNFTGNTATETGGAIFWYGANGTVFDCNFTGNTANNGGAIYWYGANGTVSGCNFTGNTANNNGGAIYWYGANGTVFDCNFTGNTANNNGGAIYWNGANGTVFDCNFTGNTANNNGGAIYWECANGTVFDCNFTGNTANNNGGAIYWNGANGTVSVCNFTGNTAKNGGAIYWHGDNGTVSVCNFTGNNAAQGGAIYWECANGNVSGCNFTGNTAYFGGAIYWECADGNVSGCNFTGNTANNNGGAIIWHGANGTVSVCNFTGNTANWDGGAIYWNGADGTVSGCTFINNTANWDGGAISVKNYNLNATKCAIVNNIAPTGSEIYIDGGNVNLNYNWWGSNNPNWNNLIVDMEGNPYVPSVYAVLNVTADPTEIDTSGQSNIATKFVWNGTTIDATNSLPKRNVKLSSNGTLTETEGDVGLTSQFSATSDGIYYVNATVDNEIIGVNVKVNGSGPTPIPTNITVNTTSLDLTLGENGTINATLNPPEAGNLTVNYDDKIITVTQNTAGIWYVTPKTEGNTTITFSFPGNEHYAPAESKTITVTVNRIPTEIEIASETITLNVSDSASAGASLTPADAGNLVYTSNNTEVAIVDGNGVIKGLKGGSATITVSFDGNERYAPAENKTIIVTVKLRDASVSVNNDTLDLTVDDTFELVATTVPSGLNVTYTTSNASIVTVDANGKVTAKAKGSAIITASVGGDGVYVLNSTNVGVTVNEKPIPPKKNLTIEATAKPITVGQNSNVIVTGFKDAAGNVTVTIGSNKWAGKINKGTANIVVTGLKESVIASVNYPGDDKYNSASTTVKITVNPKPKENLTISASAEPITVGENANVIVTGLKDATGEVMVTVNGKTYAVYIKNGGATVIVPGLKETVTASVNYPGDSKYNSASTTVKITVNPKPKENLTISASAEPITVGENANIIVTGLKDATGEISVIVNGKKYTSPIKGGEASVTILGLTESITADVNYPGDEKYNSASTTVKITVNPNVIIYAPDVTKYYGGSERFIVTLTDLNGNPIKNAVVKITINGRPSNRTTDDNGIASMGINLNSGVYITTTEYNGTKVNSTVTVKDTVIAKDFSKIFRNGTQYQGTFVDSQGNLIRNTDIEININGVFYTRKTDGNGVAQMNINLPPGTYILTATNPLSKEQHTTKVTVLPNIVENHDLTKYYKNASQYSLRLLDDTGNPVGAGVSVQLNINGVFYTKTSDANGYVKMNINLPPGTYIITAEYKGLRASNTIKVLSILETRDLVMKYKDGSKFEAKVLDGQGKPYAGQTVTFNINGVFYTKTTETDGIARLKINLLAGEYIITSMYNGLNSANKVTISG